MGRLAGRGALICSLVLVLTGCGSATGGTPAQHSLTLYTCISDTTIQPVITAFEDAHPGVRVGLFRAPTGQLNARVAADARSGGLRADVVWACDPLTQQAFVDQGLTGGWTPPDSPVPAEHRTADFVAGAVLYVVAVHRTDVPAPQAWSDLAGSAYGGRVAVPDPAVAASALGALGWFAAAPGYGLDFYRQLKAAGGVQVSTPDDVTTGVAQGRYTAGITIATSAYAAKKDGSPVDVAWPAPGAVAIDEPLALARHTDAGADAKQFISFVTGPDGQKAVAAAGSYPALPGLDGPTVPSGAPVVTPDWATIAAGQKQMLAEYQQVFGG